MNNVLHFVISNSMSPTNFEIVANSLEKGSSVSLKAMNFMW